jgi:hypothetical protein
MLIVLLQVRQLSPSRDSNRLSFVQKFRVFHGTWAFSENGCISNPHTLSTLRSILLIISLIPNNIRHFLYMNTFFIKNPVIVFLRRLWNQAD